MTVKETTTGPIHVTKSGRVLEVRIERGKANAIDAATSRIMGDVFASFRDDPELRVAILTGTGEKFSAPAGTSRRPPRARRRIRIMAWAVSADCRNCPVSTSP